MKKFISVIVFCIAAISLSAQQIPDSLIQAFAQQFPKVKNPEWKLEDGYYRATYIDSLGMRQTAIFDEKGQYEMRYYALSDKLVPAKITVYLSRSYPGFQDYTVYRMVDAEENVLNFVNNKKKGETIYFDRTGEFYKKVPIELKVVESLP